MNLYRYKEQYSKTMSLAVPVILSQTGQIVVQLADNAMVGRLGAQPLAAVAFGGTVIFILFIFGMGLSIGLTPIVGELLARRDYRGQAVYLQNAVILYAFTGILIMGLQYLAIPLLGYMGQPEQVVQTAVPYYKYLMWSMIPFMLFAPLKQFMEGIGNTKAPMLILIAANMINIILNWVFIYGNLGAPALGAAGAGLATMISRICCPILGIAYFMGNRTLRRYLSLCPAPKISWRHIRSLFGMGIPIALQMTLESSAFVITTIMMGWISTTALAANQIAITMVNVAFMIVTGISSATTIRISYEYGLRDFATLRLSATASYHIGLLWNMATASLFILLRNHIPLIFTSDSDVVQLSSHLLVLAAVFQFSDGLQCVSMGILRGIQDVKITAVIAAFSYLVINLPVGYIIAFHFNGGAPGLWYGYIFGLSIAAVLLNRRYHRKLKTLSSARLPDTTSAA